MGVAAIMLISRTLTLMTDGPWVQGGPMFLILTRDSFTPLGYNVMRIDLFSSSWGFSWTKWLLESISGSRFPPDSPHLIVIVSFLFPIHQVAGKLAFQNPELLWDLGSLKARSQPWALLTLWVRADWKFWTSGLVVLHKRSRVLSCGHV